MQTDAQQIEDSQIYIRGQINPINSQCKTLHACLFCGFITVVEKMRETTRNFTADW